MNPDDYLSYFGLDEENQDNDEQNNDDDNENAGGAQQNQNVKKKTGVKYLVDVKYSLTKKVIFNY